MSIKTNREKELYDYYSKREGTSKAILINKINGTRYTIKRLPCCNCDLPNISTNYVNHTITIKGTQCLSEEIQLLKKEIAKVVLYEYGIIDHDDEIFDINEVAVILARYGTLVDGIVKKYYAT